MQETVRSVVKTWELDAVQHFTTAFYYKALSSATMAMLSQLGHEPCAADAPWTQSCWTRFLRELRVGDAYHVMSGLVDADDTSCTLGHQLFNSETGELCTTFLQRLSKPPMGARADDRVEWPERASERQAVVAEGASWERTAAGVVRPEELDGSGRQDLSALIHMFSDSNIQLQNALGMTSSYMRDEAIGYSTAEYQLEMQCPPPAAGTRLEVSSTVAHLGTSSLWFVHQMNDATADAPLARLVQLGVHLDTSARKPSAVPEFIRERAMALMGGKR
jgi:acyl-CoA thioesterase FadM